MADSYFTDTSAFRRVHRERFVAFGGPRAVLLQGAHPLVMAGLVGHSDDLDKFRARLIRTARIMEVIGFGSRRRADELLRTIHGMHAKVRGNLDRDAGRFPEGTRYGALAPELQLWVLFTMADSAMLAHTLFVRPLEPAEQQAFWDDWKRIGLLFGLRRTDLPDTIADFHDYRRDMLDGDRLHVTDAARRWIPPAVLEFPAPMVYRPLLAVHRFTAVSLLPPRIRAEYGLDRMPRPIRSTLLTVLSRTIRSVRPVLPETIRIAPDARGAVDESVEPGRSDGNESMADRFTKSLGA
ncbi:Uncharacterized conserved protein, DUF2236 family [Amycolatopsis marina]|uniref:Uncharacterized conserved protein, DUF2236 family n=1 Tax=Amycolatopsis marina TaxID=490629 RepID=A0A1I0XVL5_9PSEU|nr:oxygenase MpaB family protein [Amycolatopsis marina]SFB04486.1 Uncharacterized conserved protein, DUF2236 family [Amycolatopsis marina]